MFCSTSIQKFLIVFEIFKKELFRDRPQNSFMGPFSEKKRKLYFKENMIPSNFCSITLFKMFVVFEIYEVKERPVLAPKIPYYVTYDLDFDMMR